MLRRAPRAHSGVPTLHVVRSPLIYGLASTLSTIRTALNVYHFRRTRIVGNSK